MFEKGQTPWSKGKKLTKEHKEKISLAKKGGPCYWKGKKRPDMSERMKGENNPMYGRTGPKNPCWNGGIKYHEGYRTFYMPWHPNSGIYGYVHEQVLRASQALKRPLKKGELVHHVNGNRLDNRNCNLLICDRGYHTWLHWKMADLYMKEHFGGVYV